MPTQQTSGTKSMYGAKSGTAAMAALRQQQMNEAIRAGQEWEAAEAARLRPAEGYVQNTIQGDREARETASATLKSVKSGGDRETVYDRSALEGAKVQNRIDAQEAARDSAALRKSNADKIAAGNAAGDTRKAAALADIKANGMTLNGIPVVEDGAGGVKYDLVAIGKKAGMNDAEIQQAANVTFGNRELTTTQKLDDLIGSGGARPTGAQGNEGARQAGRLASKDALGDNPTVAMLNNIAQLDPMEARLDFANEDHLTNLGKKGYFSDSNIDQRQRLDSGQGATGIGKYAQVYLPMAVQAFMSAFVGPAAGVAMGAVIGAKDVAQDNQSWGDWAKNTAINVGTSVAGTYAGAALTNGYEGGQAGTGILEGAKEGIAGVGMSDFGLAPFAATSGMGPTSLEVNQGPGFRGGSLSEQANQVAMQETGMFGGLGGNLNQGAYQGTASGMEVDPQFGARHAGIDELGGPYRSANHDPFSADPIGAPIERVTDPMDNLSPEELLAKVATGQGTLNDAGQFVGIPGTKDPLSGVIAPLPQAGGDIPTEVGQGLDIGMGDLATLVGSVGLPILSDLFGKDPKTKKRGQEYLESGLGGDIGSESTGEDPFSEMQMISAGIR